jgi:hypothetical protein
MDNKAEESTSAPLGTDQQFADALISKQNAQRTWVKKTDVIH